MAKARSGGGGKAPSFPFYDDDFWRDLDPHPYEIAGIWLKIMGELHYAEPRGWSEKTLSQWAKFLGLSTDETARALEYLGREKIAFVTPCNALKQKSNADCNARVTVMSRRMERERKAKEKTRIRVERHRKKTDVTRVKRESNDQCNGHVHAPSSSSSSSSSKNTSTQHSPTARAPDNSASRTQPMPRTAPRSDDSLAVHPDYARYFEADGEYTPDREDVECMKKLFRWILNAHPRENVKRLAKLRPYSIGQVIQAAYVFVEDRKPVELGAPFPYFLEMVRNDAGKHQSYMQRKELADEKKKQRARERDTGDRRYRGNGGDFRHAGKDVLPHMPSLQRGPDRKRRPATKKKGRSP